MVVQQTFKKLMQDGKPAGRADNNDTPTSSILDRKIGETAAGLNDALLLNNYAGYESYMIS
jgi:hypothetical protein